MNTKQKISPLKKDSLRQAGQSLTIKIEEIFTMDILYPLIVTIFLILMAVFEWVRFYFDIHDTQWIYTLIAIASIVYCLIKVRLSIKKVKDLRLGCEGEKIVAESLEELREVGYKIYNDIVWDGFNIDHVIVGPAGVFTIETKTYRKRPGANSQIYYNGKTVMIDGVKSLKDPIKQAIGQKYQLEGFIKDNAKMDIKVRPVVIFPNWFIKKDDNKSDVLVFNEKSLSGFLKKEEMLLNQEQINLISSHIESYNRNN